MIEKTTNYNNVTVPSELCNAPGCGAMSPAFALLVGFAVFPACDAPPLESAIPSNIEDVSSLLGESCNLEWPSKYVLAPSDVLDWTPLDADTQPVESHPPPPATPAMYNTTSTRPGSPGSTIGASEGRLIGYLRSVAARHDAMGALCESARAYAGDGSGGIGGAPRPIGALYGNAMADLAVTGRQSFAGFRMQSPTLESLRTACRGIEDASLNRALDRAYAVANAIRIRGIDAEPTPERAHLGWIAVSGEDDKPYRPVNVPTAPFPQFDVNVDVSGLAGTLTSVHTRYLIAHARPPQFRQAPALVRGGAREVKGDLEPAIATDAEVLIFVHGMGSRAEEALTLTRALHRLARDGGKNWTVVSFDMPASGYADSIDHELFGRADEVGCHKTPLVDFLENYVVRFVDAVDAQVGGSLKPRVRAVIGGSLGGSMALRLGRRDTIGASETVPWLHSVVSWSPASIWPPNVNRDGQMCDQGFDLFKLIQYGVVLKDAIKNSNVTERANDRRNLFYAVFDWAPPTLRPLAEYWWRDGWPCKANATTAARMDRQETYDALSRRYHWRLGAEQLAFSHRQNRGPDPTLPELAKPLFLSNRVRTLLVAGQEDIGQDIGKWTNETAPLMRNTPGRFRFLANTGHSIHDERPTILAAQIADFLAADPTAPD